MGCGGGGVKRVGLAGKGVLKIVGGQVGNWIFKLGGLRLRAAAPAGIGTYPPTEMAIGLAANQLFEDLPQEMRRQLAGLPGTGQEPEADVPARPRQARGPTTGGHGSGISSGSPDRAGRREPDNFRSAKCVRKEHSRRRARWCRAPGAGGTF